MILLLITVVQAFVTCWGMQHSHWHVLRNAGIVALGALLFAGLIVVVPASLVGVAIGFGLSFVAKTIRKEKTG